MKPIPLSWIRAMELATALALLGWRIACYPWTLWGDFIVILALYWISLVLLPHPRSRAVATVVASLWILTVYSLHHLPPTLELLRWAL